MYYSLAALQPVMKTPLERSKKYSETTFKTRLSIPIVVYTHINNLQGKKILKSADQGPT